MGLVERMSLADLANGLTDGALAYQMADLATYPLAAVVVEERSSQVFKNEYVQGGRLADLVAELQVRCATIPIVFCEARPHAEEWTFRFLGASLTTASPTQTTPLLRGVAGLSDNAGRRRYRTPARRRSSVPWTVGSRTLAINTRQNVKV